jgi:hypothetical protein
VAAAKRKVFVPPNENRIVELERHRHHRLLVEFLDRLDAEHGPVDESLIEKYIGLLR